MTVKYYHLTAMVNDQIKDILVEKSLFDEETRRGKEGIEDFFVSHATDHINNGLLEITGGDFLPDIIG